MTGARRLAHAGQRSLTATRDVRPADVGLLVVRLQNLLVELHVLAARTFAEVLSADFLVESVSDSLAECIVSDLGRGITGLVLPCVLVVFVGVVLLHILFKNTVLQRARAIQAHLGEAVPLEGSFDGHLLSRLAAIFEVDALRHLRAATIGELRVVEGIL